MKRGFRETVFQGVGVLRPQKRRPQDDAAKSGARQTPHSPGVRIARRLAALMATALIVTLGMGASSSDVRFKTLGHRMMCPCGCYQPLLECNHVGCQYSDRMRAELASLTDREQNDDVVLNTFVQKYGPTVLSAPTKSGFNLVAWVTPPLALAIGTVIAMAFAKRLKVQAVANEPTSAAQMWGTTSSPDTTITSDEVEALRLRTRQETEL
jgi:cytochrome c-type biogenesis protein CcmH/NrfF